MGASLHSILVRKPEGKRLLGRPRRRREDSIKMIFRKWGVAVWTGLIWLGIGQVAGTCECGNKLPGSIKRGN